MENETANFCLLGVESRPEPNLTEQSGQKLDSPDLDPVHSAIRTLVQHLHYQEEQMKQLKQDLLGMAERQEGMLTAVSEQIATFTSQFARHTTSPQSTTTNVTIRPVSTPAVTTPALPVQLARPEKFSGDSGGCCSFLTQFKLHFELQAPMFLTERSKIVDLISH